MSLCLHASLAQADSIRNQFQRRASDKDGAEIAYRALSGDEAKLVVVPVPIANPTIGNGLALAGLYTFSTSTDPSSPRSTLAAAAGYTDTESWAAGAGFNLHLADDRYRLSLAAGLGEFNLEYYGVGSDSLFANNPVEFSASGEFLDAGVSRRLLESLYGGLAIRYLNAEISTEIPIDVLPELTVPFRLLGVGPTLQYDSRENSWWPREGTLASAELLWYTDTFEIFSFDLQGDFRTFDLSVAQYHSILDDLVFAGQVGFSTASEDAPFFMKPFVSVRGFPSGRYLNSAVIQAQGEIRWNAWKGLGAVAFAGVGVTGPEIDEFENTAYGFGVGLRYRVSEADRMNIGVDAAFGDGDLAVYFRIGEAF